MKSGGFFFAVVAVGALLVACTAPADSTEPTASSAGADTFTVDGTIVIINSGIGDSAQARLTRVKDDPDSLDCTGANAYEFLAEGQSVTVRDADSTVVGVGRLSPGIDRTPPKDNALECTFTFTVPDVVASPFYSVQYGSGTPIQYTAEELRAGLEDVVQ